MFHITGAIQTRYGYVNPNGISICRLLALFTIKNKSVPTIQLTRPFYFTPNWPNSGKERRKGSSSNLQQ